MIDFKDDNSPIYRRGIIYLQFVVFISLLLSKYFDNKSFSGVESFFRFLGVITSITGLLLLGTREIIAKKNKIGYLYYFITLVFIITFILFFLI